MEINCSFPLDENGETELIFENPRVQVVLVCLYSLVFIFCFFGNLTVVLVMTLHWRMRTITKFCLGNLAFANLCVGIFCIYQNLSLFLIDSWIFGEFLCKMYHFINSLSHTASILILVVIAVERYLVITYPFQCRSILTIQRLRLIILSVWIASALICSPRLYYIRTIENPMRVSGGNEVICALGSSLFDSRAADLINFILLFLLPLVIISILYTKIGIFLKNREPVGSGRNGFNASLTISESEPEIRNGFNDANKHLEKASCPEVSHLKNQLNSVDEHSISCKCRLLQSSRGRNSRRSTTDQIQNLNGQNSPNSGRQNSQNSSGKRSQDSSHPNSQNSSRKNSQNSSGQNSQNSSGKSSQYYSPQNSSHRNSSTSKDSESDDQISEITKYHNCQFYIDQDLGAPEAQNLIILGNLTSRSPTEKNSKNSKEKHERKSKEKSTKNCKGINPRSCKEKRAINSMEKNPRSSEDMDSEISDEKNAKICEGKHSKNTGEKYLNKTEGNSKHSGRQNVNLEEGEEEDSCRRFNEKKCSLCGVVLPDKQTQHAIYHHRDSCIMKKRFKSGISKRCSSSGDGSGFNNSGSRTLAITNRGRRFLFTKIHRSHQSAVRMLITIVTTFAICNLPFHLRKLYQNYVPESEFESDITELATPLTFLLMYANCAINPILYAFMSHSFRSSMIEFFRCKLRKRFAGVHERW